ncbi:MAG: ArdC family protein [Acidimicrobiia bacterium]
MNYSDLASHVTARLVARIEAGASDWSMPWHTNPGLLDVRNAATGLPYRTGALWVSERAESQEV